MIKGTSTTTQTEVTKRAWLICDLETSGLSANLGATILEAGFMLLKGADDPDPKTLVVTICPTEAEWKFASPDALKVNGFTLARLQAEGIPMAEAKIKILSWMAENDINAETTQYIGQNPMFDLRFLDHFMGAELRFMGFPFLGPTDCIQLAKKLVERDRSFRVISFKGKDIALSLGVEPEGDLHTALGGLQAVLRNYTALGKRLGFLQ